MEDFVRLEHTQGHNKFYELWLEYEHPDWVTYFKYGAIGTTGVQGQKYRGPSKGSASKFYTQVKLEKMNKGYEVVQEGSAFKAKKVSVAQELKKQSNEVSSIGIMAPMALNTDNIDSFLSDPDWALQEKKNGRFLRIYRANGTVMGYNKLGKMVVVNKKISDALPSGDGDLILDGELIKDQYWPFDILRYGVSSFKKSNFSDRLDQLNFFIESCENSDYIRKVPVAVTHPTKQKLFDKLQSEGREGAVLKSLLATYQPGDSPCCYKVKFWKEASVLAMQWTQKSSVLMGCYKNGKVVPVGSVTVPAKYTDQLKSIHLPKVLRVKYLYATKDDILYQCSLDPDDDGNVVRDDQMLEECLMSQLQYENNSKKHVDEDPPEEPKRSILI